MALLAADEIMLREPRLLTRFMQPTGKVVVAPEYGGSDAFLALGNGNGPDTMQLLTPSYGGLTIRPTGGRTTQDFYADNIVWESQRNAPVSGAEHRTYLWIGRILTIPGNAVIFEHGAASGNGVQCQIMVFLNNLCMHMYGDWWITTGVAATAGTEYVLGFTYAGGTSLKMFLNGRLRETATLPGALNTGLSTVKSNNPLTYFKSALPTENELIGILPRALTDDEMLAWMADPYMIVQPA